MRIGGSSSRQTWNRLTRCGRLRLEFLPVVVFHSDWGQFPRCIRRTAHRPADPACRMRSYGGRCIFLVSPNIEAADCVRKTLSFFMQIFGRGCRFFDHSRIVLRRLVHIADSLINLIERHSLFLRALCDLRDDGSDFPDLQDDIFQ